MSRYLSPDALARDLAIRDLTDPTQGEHALQVVVDSITQALAQAWECEVQTGRESPVVSLDDNYELLGYATDAVTRDVRYTRYVDAQHVLRSHSTAMIPGALRALASKANPPSDVLLSYPGICYRRDSVDWQHTGTPHQLDLWRIKRGAPTTEADLEDQIARVVTAALPGAPWRTIPAVHPYTTHGREIYAEWNGVWVEIGECGLAAPHVLRKSGLDTDEWSGTAMGMGIDRLVMLRKGIPDIRLLRSTDERIAGQMRDLSPYKAVSPLPPVRRDLSVVVGPDVEASDELLGDRVRDALGDDADVAETVEVLSETPYERLPQSARERLGIRPGQRNVLLRLVLRPVDRTLTDEQANVLRDRVYAELHEGANAEWTAVTA